MRSLADAGGTVNSLADESRAPRISAVICTHNRSAYLAQAIRSVADQTLPHDQYEVIVVDNASTDNTKAVVDGFAGAANLRYLYEPVLGLSQARNTGWQSARGKYVAYLDDDAIASPDWLGRILSAFETVQPAPGSVGGKVTPIWETPKPAWLPKELEPALTIVDWDPAPTFIDIDRQFLAGTNVAYPASALRSAGGFSTSLGRKGDRLLSSEEVLVSRALLRQGLGSYYDPLICVSHHIASQRLTKSWFYRRYFWQGVSIEILTDVESDQAVARPSHLRRIWRLTLSLLRHPSNLWRLVTPGGTSAAVLSRTSAYYLTGRIYGQLRLGLTYSRSR